jgi:hypothetical protein
MGGGESSDISCQFKGPPVWRSQAIGLSFAALPQTGIDNSDAYPQRQAGSLA